MRSKPAVEWSCRSEGRASRSIAALVVALALVGVAAASGSIPFQRLSLDEGLSQSTVYSILQDHRGYMWFGTLEGLNRYDGNQFQVYAHDANVPGSLSHDRVSALAEDREGVLWIGTRGGGVDRFDEASGTFSHLRHDPGDPRTVSSDRIRALLVDMDNVLWVGTDDAGLNRFDRETETFARFLHDPEDPTSLSADHVTSLHQDRSRAIWVGTDGGGLNRLDPRTGIFERFSSDAADPRSLSSDRIRTVFEDSSGDLWVGTYDGGLNRLDRGTRGFTRFRHDPDDDASLSNDQVRAVMEDSDGRLWIGTDSGLDEWVPETGAFLRNHHEPADRTSLSNDQVTRVYQDRGGVLWVGTYGGLNRWNPAAGTFSHFKAEAGAAETLSDSNVFALHEGRRGEVWVGTWGGGLNRLDRESGRVRAFRHRPGDPTSLSDDRVMSLLVDREGVVWAGTVAGGLNRFDEGRGVFERFSHDPADPDSLSANGVTSIVEGRRERLWVGTFRGGLNSLDRATGRFRSYRHNPVDRHSLSSDLVIALHQDRSGALWVGTEDGGLNHLDPITGHVQRYRHDPQDPSSLSSDAVWSVLEDRRGDLWIGTQTGGLNRWRAADRQALRPIFERYTTEDGLLSNLIYGILEDAGGNLWLSSNRGLSRLDPDRETFRHYDRSHGLQDREFNGGAYFRADSGEMFFGGANGFNAFYPSQLRGNSHVPPVEITGFLKFNQPFDLGVPLWRADAIELAYNDSVIAFDFAALDYTAPEKNRYLHKLEGFDRDWVESDKIHRATYTNLDPGDYVFRVKASNNEGVWNEEGASLRIHVAPPPWASWWAFGIYGLLAAAMVISFSRAQHKKRAHAAELETTNQSLERQIAERKRAEEALLKLSSAVEQSPASVMITDPRGSIEYVNPRFEEITGYKLDEIRGCTPKILESGYTDGDKHAEVWRAVGEGKQWRGELHSRKKDGSHFWEVASVSPIRSPEGKITHILAANEDITVRKEYEEKLLHQEHFDSLTELPNRALAFDRLSRALVQRKSTKDIVAVVCVDLDNFKIVNDTLGHATGDELLIESGKRLTATVGPAPTVARLGGDEFLVILSNLANIVEAEVAAAKIRDAFTRPFTLDGRDIFITAGLGITAAPVDGEDPQVLLRNADAAMHMAKKQGRGAYRFFTPAMNDKVSRRLSLESALRQALEKGDELAVAYQPILDIATGRVEGVEALLRWRSAELGKVSPEEFIPIAEETGMIVSIGRWVLETACAEARRWRDEMGRPLRIAVNVSSRQFSGCDLMQVTSRALANSGLPGEALELEITEGLLLEDSPEVLATLRSLSDIGVRLSIDDFGTGYSALNYLKKYPFDTLKIDRSFVAGVPGVEDQAALVNAILAMGHGLSLEVIAEGVESETQFRFLRSIGCDYAQGHYFCRAVAAEELLDLLRDREEREEGLAPLAGSYSVSA